MVSVEPHPQIALTHCIGAALSRGHAGRAVHGAGRRDRYARVRRAADEGAAAVAAVVAAGAHGGASARAVGALSREPATGKDRCIAVPSATQLAVQVDEVGSHRSVPQQSALLAHICSGCSRTRTCSCSDRMRARRSNPRWSCRVVARSGADADVAGRIAQEAAAAVAVPFMHAWPLSAQPHAPLTQRLEQQSPPDAQGVLSSPQGPESGPASQASVSDGAREGGLVADEVEAAVGVRSSKRCCRRRRGCTCWRCRRASSSRRSSRTRARRRRKPPPNRRRPRPRRPWGPRLRRRRRTCPSCTPGSSTPRT